MPPDGFIADGGWRTLNVAGLTDIVAGLTDILAGLAHIVDVP
jgi:hypothetical protein